LAEGGCGLRERNHGQDTRDDRLGSGLMQEQGAQLTWSSQQSLTAYENVSTYQQHRVTSYAE